jgi:hypothetical protein
MDLVSDIGGAQGGLFILGSYFAGLIAKRLLYAAMIK